MKREAIERLAVDSAAGELNEDAEALLRTYLAEHPRANKWAEDLRLIYDKTETAIQTKTAQADAVKVIPSTAPVSRVKWLSVARWAAAIVIGIMIGFTAERWAAPEKAQRIVVQEYIRDSKRIETVSDLKQKYEGTFWGNKMLALLEPGQRYKANLSSIGTWDKYRQYIKEKHNE